MTLVLVVPVMHARAGDGGMPTRVAADSSKLDSIISPRSRTDTSESPGVAGVREWNFSVAAQGTLTYSDNVSLARPGQERADLVTGLTVPLGVRRDGPRLKATVDYVPTVYLYARTGQSNELQNNLRSLVTLEAVEDFVFVDATANVYQSYLSTSAPRPISGASITDNRTQQTVVGLSPYLRHDSSGGWTYLVRNENFWNIYSAEGISNSRVSRLLVDAKSPPARLRYGLDSTYQYTRDQAQPSAYYQQVTRMRGIFALTPRVNAGPRLGYESND